MKRSISGSRVGMHLHVRQNHAIGVQASANSVGFGVLNKAEHDLARPGRMLANKFVSCGSFNEKERWQRRYCETHFCGQRPLVKPCLAA
jgi:hypothetical protein